MSGNCIQYLLQLIVEGFFASSSASLVGAYTRTLVVFMYLEWNLAVIIRSLTGDQLSRHLLMAYLVITIATNFFQVYEVYEMAAPSSKACK